MAASIDVALAVENHFSTQRSGVVPFVQVWYAHAGMWWELPLDVSLLIMDKREAGCAGATYVWDWRTTRKGTYSDTSLSRYEIDFKTMMQRNLDDENNVRRPVQIIYRILRVSEMQAFSE